MVKRRPAHSSLKFNVKRTLEMQMPQKQDVGCTRPTGGVVGDAAPEMETVPQTENNGKGASSMIKVGQKAPDFEVPAYYNGDFASVKLSEYLGKWVVLCFYPGDFTFVCATEVSAIAEKYKEFEKVGIQVLPMSTDSMFVHKMWVDHELSKMNSSGTIPFPMLSDAGGKVGDIYGVYDEGAGVDVRGRFLIDPDGVVQGFEVLAPPVGRNVLETLRQIQAFQLVRESKGTQATPSGWKPGKATLKPGADLVGKVWEAWSVDKAFD